MAHIGILAEEVGLRILQDLFLLLTIHDHLRSFALTSDVASLACQHVRKNFYKSKFYNIFNKNTSRIT